MVSNLYLLGVYFRELAETEMFTDI
jgi:hypothetical protein